MSLIPRATHVLQWIVQKVAISREGANLKNYPQFRLKSEIRLHEAGIASNRRSAHYGEYVPGSCTHRPSHHGSWFYLKAKLKTFDHGIVSDWGEVVTR